MKLHRSALAALLLAPLAASVQEADSRRPSANHAGEVLPGLSPGAVVVRLAPDELQGLLSGGEGYRVVEQRGKWMRLEPLGVDEDEYHHAWIDTSRISGYVLLAEEAWALDTLDVDRCKANLTAIARGLLEYKAKYRRMPAGSGARFLAALISDGVWPNDAEHALRLTCPAVLISELPTLRGKPEADWYRFQESVDEGSTAYFARDQKHHPIRKFPTRGREILVACDHHSGEGGRRILVLRGNLKVSELEGRLAPRKGVVGPGEQLVLGPGSQDAELRKLARK